MIETIEELWEEFLDVILEMPCTNDDEDYESRMDKEEYELWENREQYGIEW